MLQVNVTRITIKSGLTLGEHLLKIFHNRKYIPIAVGGSVVFGCIAFQVGNLLGAVVGLELISNIHQQWIILAIVLIASVLLWFGTTDIIVNFLGVVVALMGFVFIYIVFRIDLNISELFNSIRYPRIPIGAEIIAMGLIGTTIVPYNLFLGSGLSQGKNLKQSIMGIIVAISIGGVISMAILIVGTLTSAPLDFEHLSSVLAINLGPFAPWLLAIGLFSAGFTSCITAPLAAVYTLKSIFPNHQKFNSRSSAGYRLTWGAIMIFGLIFGLTNVKPIPAIILAQAINGIILPFIASIVLIIVIALQNKNRTGSVKLNEVLLTVVVFVIISIGVFNFLKVIAPTYESKIIVSLIVAGIVIISILWYSFSKRMYEKS